MLRLNFKFPDILLLINQPSSNRWEKRLLTKLRDSETSDPQISSVMHRIHNYHFMTNASGWDQLHDMNFWMGQRTRNRVAKHVSSTPCLAEFHLTQRGSDYTKQPTNHISMSSKLLKMYCWFGRNQLLSNFGPMHVVSVFWYSENLLRFSPSLMRRKKSAILLVSFAINRNIIN